MDTGDIWAQMARRYDTEERIQVAQSIADAIRAALFGIGRVAAMDYGCGTGLIGLALADLFDSILLVDASAQMIEQVDAKIAGAHIPNAATLCADFSQGPVPDIRVDCILMSQVLLHIRDYSPLLKTLHAMLRPGGRLIIVDFDKNDRVPSDRVHNGFVQAPLEALLRRIGFASAQAHTFYHGEKLFMQQDASLFLLQAIA